MTQNISTLFAEQFEAEVHRANQGKKMLQGLVRTKTGVIGSIDHFPKIGKISATEHVRGNDVVFANASTEDVPVTLQNVESYELLDDFDEEKLTFSLATQHAENTTDACGRKYDQLIIDAITAGYDSTNMKVGDGTAVFSLSYILQAKWKLDKNAVSLKDRYMLVSTGQIISAMQEEKIASGDYNPYNVLLEGKIARYGGFNIMAIEDRDEGGLPTTDSATKRYAYFWQKNQIGMAEGKTMQPVFERTSEKQGYIIGAKFSAGAVVIDDTGVGSIYTTETGLAPS